VIACWSLQQDYQIYCHIPVEFTNRSVSFKCVGPPETQTTLLDEDIFVGSRLKRWLIQAGDCPSTSLWEGNLKKNLKYIKAASYWWVTSSIKRRKKIPWWLTDTWNDGQYATMNVTLEAGFRGLFRYDSWIPERSTGGNWYSSCHIIHTV
jgi:hypothetical protein